MPESRSASCTHRSFRRGTSRKRNFWGHYTKRQKSYGKAALRKPIATAKAIETGFRNTTPWDYARGVSGSRNASFAQHTIYIGSRLALSWITRIGGDDIWTERLSMPLLADSDTAAANWLFAKRILNQIDVQQAIMHLLQAGKHNEAGVVYIRALHSLLEAEPDVYPGMLLSLWKSLPLPGEMDLGLRIFIRGLQIANSLRRGEDCQHSIDDLTSLIKQARDWRDQVSVYAASGLVGMQLAAKDAVRALPFISDAALGE